MLNINMKNIVTFLHSNNYFSIKVACDIEGQLLVKIKMSPDFALQCDETTDTAVSSQLLVLVNFLT